MTCSLAETFRPTRRSGTTSCSATREAAFAAAPSAATTSLLADQEDFLGDRDHGNHLYGDAGLDLIGGSRGGNDVLTGGNGTWQALYGDAGRDMFARSVGGDDRLLIGECGGISNLYGDAGRNMFGWAQGGDDHLVTGSAHPDANVALVGDAGGDMHGHARGGDDHITGQGGESDLIFGDALGNMYGYARGGDDELFSDGIWDLIAGDAGGDIAGHARGGDDELNAVFKSGSGFTPIVFFGDARGTISEQGRGGDDKLTTPEFGGVALTLYGDAQNLTDHARGGDDEVRSAGGPVGTVVYGDANFMDGHSVGGDDVLEVAAAGPLEKVIGDAFEMREFAKGGDDELISGLGDDAMWGDAVVKDATVATGSDKYVFAPVNGHDTVFDFEQGKDKIDLTAFASLGIDSFGDLDHEVVGGDTIIHFDDANDLTVVGIALQASDILFG